MIPLPLTVGNYMKVEDLSTYINDSGPHAEEPPQRAIISRVESAMARHIFALPGWLHTTEYVLD